MELEPKRDMEIILAMNRYSFVVLNRMTESKHDFWGETVFP